MASLARELQLLHVTKDFQQLVKSGPGAKTSAAGGWGCVGAARWRLLQLLPPPRHERVHTRTGGRVRRAKGPAPSRAPNCDKMVVIIALAWSQLQCMHACG